MSDKTMPFGDLLGIPLRNGVSYSSRLRGSGVSMVNMREIFASDRIGDDDFERAPITDAERLNFLLDTDDLLFARQSLSYEGAGKCSIVVQASEERTWESHLIRARLDPTIAHPAFYYYYFRSPVGRHNVETIVQQVAAAGIRGSDLARLRVPVPPLSTQQAVAEVLGALDDKIAANERRLRLSNDLTQAMFEQAARAESVVEATFADVARISGGGTPRTAVTSHWGGSIRWATPKDLTGLAVPYLRTTARNITDSGLEACSSDLHPTGSILMTSRATIGAFAVATMPTAVNQGFIVVNAMESHRQWWLFHNMRARVDEFLSFANGATFLELARGKFRGLPVHLPHEDVIRQFDAEVAPIHAFAIAVVEENERLAATRKELLPLLMSGKLRVRDAEKVVEEVV